MKTLRWVVVTVILCALSLSVARSSHTSQRVMTFAGKGVWFWKIWAESPGRNRGATFYIELPIR